MRRIKMTNATLNTYLDVSDVEGMKDDDLYTAIKREETRKTTSEIRQALFLREALIGRSHTQTEIAENTGISQSSVSALAHRGEYLYLVGDFTDRGLSNGWAQVKSMTEKNVKELNATLMAVSTDVRQTTANYATVRPLVGKRLGTLGTPETIDRLTDALVMAGNVTPKNVATYVATTADSLGIALPAPVKREGAAVGSVQDVAEVATVDKFLAMGRAVEQAFADCPDDAPMFATQSQRDEWDHVATFMVEYLAVATVYVAPKPATVETAKSGRKTITPAK
jgi:predicted XRE-type DNA-binding protein